jgi:hypothetical protein
MTGRTSTRDIAKAAPPGPAPATPGPTPAPRPSSGGGRPDALRGTLRTLSVPRGTLETPLGQVRDVLKGTLGALGVSRGTLATPIGGRLVVAAGVGT